MSPSESQQCWQHLCRLWPSWKTTSALQDAWIKRFADYSYRAFVSAIDEHWEEHAKAFQPDPAAILKLAKQCTFETISPEQQKRAAQFYAQSKLNQARQLRDHYARMVDKSEGPERSKWESLEITASAQVARLFRLHGEHCPPDYGVKTSSGAAPGSLFEQIGPDKILQPETPRDRENVLWRKSKDGT